MAKPTALTNVPLDRFFEPFRKVTIVQPESYSITMNNLTLFEVCLYSRIVALINKNLKYGKCYLEI